MKKKSLYISEKGDAAKYIAKHFLQCKLEKEGKKLWKIRNMKYVSSHLFSPWKGIDSIWRKTQNHKIIQVGGEFRKSLVQSAVQSRFSCDIRSHCWVFSPVGLWIFPIIEIVQPLNNCTSLNNLSGQYVVCLEKKEWLC